MKVIGLYGLLGYETALELFRQHEEELKLRFSKRFLEDFGKLSGMRDVCCAAMDQIVTSDAHLLYLSPIGEGGLCGALWKACEELGCGCRVELLQVPVRQEVVEICELYGEDPYEAASSGCYLVIREDEAEEQKELLSILEESAIIGKLTNDGRRVLVWDDMVRYLTPPQRQRKDIMDRKNEVHIC